MITIHHCVWYLPHECEVSRQDLRPRIRRKTSLTNVPEASGGRLLTKAWRADTEDMDTAAAIADAAFEATAEALGYPAMFMRT